MYLYVLILIVNASQILYTVNVVLKTPKIPPQTGLYKKLISHAYNHFISEKWKMKNFKGSEGSHILVTYKIGFC